MKINTNLSSLIVQSGLKSSTNGLNTAIERMTTGFKINHAKDNAANYAINTNLSTKLNAYTIAEDNANLGLEMVLTASETLSLISDLAGRLRSLAVQAQNGNYGNKSLSALNSEAQALINEIYRIKETASYNGKKLFNDFNSTVPNLEDGSKLVPNERGFLKDIVERDTSAMDKLEDVDPNSELKSGTYSISTEEELVKLAQMANDDKITGACEFVLAEDIDISNFCKSNLNANGEGGWIPISSGISQKSSLDGNGHTISGLYINRPNSDNQGFIGSQETMKVKNLGLINPEVTGKNTVGALRNMAYYKATENCYVQGGRVSGNVHVGGLVGILNYDSMRYCYSTCDVYGNDYIGGLAGWTNVGSVSYCYSTGDISGHSFVGGISGKIGSAIDNCAVYGTVNGVSDVGIFAGGGGAKLYDCTYNINVNKELSYVGDNSNAIISNIKGVNFGAKIGLQVGINSSESSRLNFNAWFALDDLGRLKKGKIEDKDTLNYVDGIILQISKKQTEYGAVQNRLESVLEQISICYDNLVSTQSTIRDADIAEESSAYIRNQILQQAAATLMATANQTPAIALQLL